MYSRFDNVYDIIYTCLMSYQGITFVVAVMPSMMLFILRCATDSSSMWAFFRAHQWRINNGAIGARAPGPRAPGGPKILNKQFFRT